MRTEEIAEGKSSQTIGGSPGPSKGLMRRFLKNRAGAAAIEFAVLALPFMLVVFATLETFIAFTGEQLLANATETMARKVRTGEITFGLGLPSDKTEKQFRQAFCDEISIIMTCSQTETVTPAQLFIDVRSYTDFSQIPTDIPRVAGAGSDFSAAGFKFSPGGPTTINAVRVFYRWQVITDLVRPYITNLRPAGSSMPDDYLMVATSAFTTESH